MSALIKAALLLACMFSPLLAQAKGPAILLDEAGASQVLLVHRKDKLACFGEEGLLGKLTPFRVKNSEFVPIDPARLTALHARRLKGLRKLSRSASAVIRGAAKLRASQIKLEIQRLAAGKAVCYKFATLLKGKNKSSSRGSRTSSSFGSLSSVGSLSSMPVSSAASSLRSSTFSSSSSSPSSSSSVSSGQLRCDRVEQYGITWAFDKGYPCGQFANGDWWVEGPLTLTAISPDYSNGRNGWEINPNSHAMQGFDSRLTGFDASRIPSLPRQMLPDQSIVKTVSRYPASGACADTCIQKAGVLTVVGAIPPHGGAALFRPNYFGVKKNYHSITEIDASPLRSLVPVSYTPSLASMESQILRFQMDHKEGINGRPMRPFESMPDYGPGIGARNAEVVLRLALNDSLAAKMGTLLGLLQYGLDLYHGAYSPGYDRTTMGTKLAISFTGLILNNAEIKNYVASAGPNSFNENHDIYLGTGAGIPLYGRSNLELSYWSHMVTGSMGGKDQRDPYGYIDGGDAPGTSYQICCSGMPWKATAVAIYLTPGLKEVWNNQNFFDYVERWVVHGTWSQPDPCAPADPRDLAAKTLEYYGVTYGPDGSGGCIRDTNPSDGIGRFPNRHGLSADTGSWGSNFGNAMWGAYYQP